MKVLVTSVIRVLESLAKIKVFEKAVLVTVSVFQLICEYMNSHLQQKRTNFDVS
jgi:hypothetical protein